MTTMMSPRNMLIAGIVLVLLNVAALAPMATNAVPDAVEDNFESFSKDSACADADCTEAEEDWASSTGQRDFYGYSITNVADVMANGTAPTYEKIGPVTYDITTTRTITGYDATAGELTYNSVKSFECAADTAVPCDTEVSQLNIAFQTQVIGATGMAIGGIMDATKAGFTMGMLAQDLESLGPGLAASQAMSASYAGAVAGAVDAGGDETMGANGVGANFYAGWDQFFAANNMSGAGETVTYSMATTSSASFDNLTYAFNSAVFPGSGEDVSLLSDVGTMVFAGHCSAFPTDLANATTRATIWNYMGSDDATTIANDYAMCYGIGGNFANNFGGGDDAWMLDTTGASVNASTRLSYLGITMDNTAAMAMLFGIPGDDAITGLLEVSESGTEFGVANFLSMEDSAAMTAYGMDGATFAAVKGWAGAWIADGKSLPMILLGGSGDMTASLFVNTTFGAEDPLNGGYLDNSLNLGGFWGIPESRDNIALDPAVSGNALYGPLGLTTDTGAAIFLYGELSGMTPPLNFSTSPPTPGAPMAWDEATIGALYGVDTNAAAAMRALMMGPIYGTTADSFVPGFLMSSFGTTPYLTQSFNNWLLGWHDPVNAFLATGNPMDMTVGWTSLETNETYYSSPNIANGDGTNYTMCTGEGGDCDQGETLAEDGSTQLSWRNDAMFAATFGLITQESLVGTTGGFLTGTGDKVDVSGYAVADITCDGTSTVKGIPVDDCSATVVATERNIQANLLETYSLLDATPGALPVYFGSEINMQAEQLSGLIIAGDSASTFYLDTRAHTSQATAPSMSDLVPVFEIKSSSMIADDDAETMESSIVQNQDKMTYWTNFDSWIDYVTLLFWVGGIAMIGMGMVGAANASSEEEDKDFSASAEEAPAEEAPAEDSE